MYVMMIFKKQTPRQGVGMLLIIDNVLI